MEKRCTVCKKIKSILEFARKGKDASGKERRSSNCRKCQAIYHKSYYERNKEYYYLRNVARKKDLLNFVRQQKDKPCLDCGIKYPFYVMDFDHREDKNFDIGRAHQDKSVPTILEELKKCDLVCSNCHRERTWQRKEQKKHSYNFSSSLNGSAIFEGTEKP